MNDDNDSSINYNNNINSNGDDEDGDDINDVNEIYTYNNVFLSINKKLKKNER